MYGPAAGCAKNTMSAYGALDSSENAKQFDRKKAIFLAAIAVLGAVLMVQMVRYGTLSSEEKVS